MPAPAPVETPPVILTLEPTRVALTRARRQLDDAEKVAQTNPGRAVILAVRAARIALVGVLIAHGAHVTDASDTTLARTVRGLGLSAAAARAFTDLTIEADRAAITRDASVALAEARLVITATSALLASALTNLT